jgi:hypothetical protein
MTDCSLLWLQDLARVGISLHKHALAIVSFLLDKQDRTSAVLSYGRGLAKGGIWNHPTCRPRPHIELLLRTPKLPPSLAVPQSLIITEEPQFTYKQGDGTGFLIIQP